MKRITVFTSFGVLKKIGEPKEYTQKSTGGVSHIQNYSVNGIMFSLFGDSQINFHEQLIDLPVIVFGRVEHKENNGTWRTNFLADSVRRDYQADAE